LALTTSGATIRPITEPAPVLSPAGPVAPGGTAHIVIALVNEDERPARIVFFGTNLIGEDGAHIPVDHVSFHPRELTLSPGSNGDVSCTSSFLAHAVRGVFRVDPRITTRSPARRADGTSRRSVEVR
jgi:hypothetical protein